MGDSSKRADARQPDEFDRDLHPNRSAGQNEQAPADGETGSRTAYDMRHLHRALSEISDDELRAVPVLPAGARLQQGATYLKLEAAEPREITATGDMEVGLNEVYVPKAEVPYMTYNRLRGIEDPRRTT
jgi:hypothetical protein